VEQVVFATDEHRRDDVESASSVSKVGFVSLGEATPGLSPSSWDDDTYRAVMNERSRIRSFRAWLRLGDDPTTMAPKYERFAAAVDELRPALMVVDGLCDHALDVAIAKGIPYVMGIAFLPSNMLSAAIPFARSHTPRGFPTPRSGLPGRMTARQRIENRLFRLRTVTTFARPDMLRRMRRQKELLAARGITESVRGSVAKVDRSALTLCYSIADLDYPFTAPERFRAVGPLIPPLPQAEPDPGLQAWLDAHDSIVYQAFGTLIRLTEAEVAALVAVARRLAGTHHVLWKLPREQQHLLPADLPANLRVESWLPSQLDVLAHPNVRLFFNHAGSNSFHEALYFGKPQVLWPLFVDCHDIAVRAVDAGVGLQLDRSDTVDADDVTAKLLEVAGTPAFRARAEHFSRLLRDAGGVAAAADLLLALPALTTNRGNP
jgi:polyene glycosyltransferase